MSSMALKGEHSNDNLYSNKGFLAYAMTSEFAAAWLPAVFVPLIGLVTPAVFIVLVGRHITATD